MKTNLKMLLLAVVAGTGAILTAPSAAAQQILHSHVPEAVAGLHLQPTGRLASTNRLNLAIALPLRNRETLTNLLQQLYDPASTNYHHYLTPEQFAEMFGPTESDYQAVIGFAEANGLTVTGTHPNRLLLDVSGAVPTIEKTFHVTMRTYRHPQEMRMFYAPDVEPSVDLAVPVLHISGLDNYSLPHPRLQVRSSEKQDASASSQSNDGAGRSGTASQPNAGAGPSGTYMANDFRAAYVPGTSLTGAGQAVGLLQFDGHAASDVAYYIATNHLSSVTISNVLLDGFSGTPTGNGGEVEVCLDIEMVLSMAPGISEIYVYEAGPSGVLGRYSQPHGQR